MRIREEDRHNHNIEGQAIRVHLELQAGNMELLHANVITTRSYRAGGLLWRLISCYTATTSLLPVTYAARDGNARVFKSLKPGDSLLIHKSTNASLPVSNGETHYVVAGIYVGRKTLYKSPGTKYPH